MYQYDRSALRPASRLPGQSVLPPDARGAGIELGLTLREALWLAALVAVCVAGLRVLGL
jgi:hypothetical protein